MEIYEYPRTSPKSFPNISSYSHPVPFAVLLPETLQSYTPRRRAMVSLRQSAGYILSLTFYIRVYHLCHKSCFIRLVLGPIRILPKLSSMVSCQSVLHNPSITITLCFRRHRGGTWYVAEYDPKRISYDVPLQRIKSRRLTHS
jgi:hypothetical protein